MLHESTQKLIQKLWDLSARGDIPWRASGEAAWAFDTEGYVVEVREDPSELRILRHDGREIERANVEQLTRTRLSSGGHYGERVAELAGLARSRQSVPAPPPPTGEPAPQTVFASQPPAALETPPTPPPSASYTVRSLPPQEPRRARADALFGAIPSFSKDKPS